MAARQLLLPLWLLVSLLAACSLSGPVKLYEGDLAPDQVAKLMLPLDVDLLEVDGKKTRVMFTSKDVLTYELAPGVHDLSLRYETFKKDRQGNETSVASELFGLTLTLQAGEVYTLKEQLPETYEEAIEFAKHPRLTLISRKSGTQSEASLLPPNRQIKPLGGLLSSDKDTPLTNLEYWWEKASPDEKEAFREYLKGK